MGFLMADWISFHEGICAPVLKLCCPVFSFAVTQTTPTLTQFVDSRVGPCIVMTLTRC